MILASATIGSTEITGPDTTGIPAAYQPTWVNKANKIIMDQKKQPLPVKDRIIPAGKKITANQVQQTTLLDTAGHMLGLIRAAGIKPPADLFCLFQMYHETGGFTSALFLHYNACGIKFANKSGASQGPGSNYYAYFTSWEPYMATYKKILEKGANPLGAETLEDFAHRLKLNGYYEVSEADYLAGLLRAQKALKGFTTGAAAYQEPENAFMKWWHGLPWYGKGGVILGSLIGLKIVTK